MNLATKIIVGADKGESIKLTWRFCIMPTSGFVYLKETKRDKNKTMKIDS